MKNNYLFFLLVLSWLFSGNRICAQQLPIFTQYQEYHSFINPASISNDYMMAEYNFQSGISYRTHINAVEGAPVSTFFRGEYILKTKAAFDLSFGGFLLSHNTDPFKASGAYGKIAALFSDDPFYGAFSVGLTFGGLQYRIDTKRLQPFHLNDVIITDSNEKRFSPDVGIGAYYYKQIRNGKFGGDVFYTGISVPQVLGYTTRFTGEDDTSFSFQQERHYYGQAGFYKYFNELSFLHPSLWVKYVPNAPLHINLNVQYQISNKYWAGLGFSTSKIVSLEGGLYLKAFSETDQRRFKIGYGLGFSTSKLNNLFGTSHEINLAYLMDTRKKK